MVKNTLFTGLNRPFDQVSEKRGLLTLPGSLNLTGVTQPRRDRQGDLALIGKATRF